MIGHLYNCCKCFDGPKGIKIQPQCVACGHVACSNCSLEVDGNSKGFKYALRKEFNTCAAFREIASKTIEIFDIYKTVSGVKFDLVLDIGKTVSSQLNGSWDIGSMLVLSGTVEQAYATTCQHYVELVWGVDGWSIIESIVSACKSPGNTGLRKHLGVQYQIICEQSDCSSLIATGGKNSIAKLATMLAWVVTVLRGSESRRGHLAYSSPLFRFCTINKEDLSSAATLEIPGFADYGILEWRITTEEPHTIYSRSCWLPLFKNFTMADGFPVPEREGEVGLEISFEAMVSLGRISYSLELSVGTILKGYSTMLIPTSGSAPESIQWHFIGSENPGEYISPSCIPDALIPDILDLDVDTLRQRRGFIGYYREAYVYAGTRDSRFDQVQLSDAERHPTTLRIGREISPTMNSSGMGIFGAGIGAKFILTKGLFSAIKEEEACLEDRLLNSKDNPTVIYDVSKTTGFLIPELNVILQIIHTWASRQTDKDSLLSILPFVDPSHHGGQVAYDAILSNKNLILREGYADEKKLFFMSKLKEVFLAVEKRKEQQRLITESSIPIAQSFSIRGWELYDIAACRPSWEKRVKLPLRSTESWHTIPRDNPDMIVLFCKGMADAIRPAPDAVCIRWNPLPRGYYLLAQVHCVQYLTERHGGSCSKPKLTATLFLKASKNANIFGPCHESMREECNHVQLLVTTPPDYNFPLAEKGAVIFGKTTSRNYLRLPW